MKEFKDKTAVITGGASGMGRAFADIFGAAGCKLVLADIEKPTLDAAVDELKAAGVDAIGVITDVSQAADMEALAKTAFEAYGQVNLLFNNAGVASGGPILNTSLKDWEWVLGVNVWGVIHGLNIFLPHMVEHGDAHIVNTASVAGLTSYPSMGPYNVSKHSVVTLSETLFNELREMDSSVGVSVLCPGIVKTNIIDSERNRRETMREPGIPSELTTEEESVGRAFVDAIYDQGLEADVVAEQVKAAILDNQFYIWTDLVYEEAIANRHEDIIKRRNPTKRKHLLEEDQNKRF